MLTLDEILERIASRYDEVTIMEALEITSEELVERFADKVNTNSWKFELEEEYPEGEYEGGAEVIRLVK